MTKYEVVDQSKVSRHPFAINRTLQSCRVLRERIARYARKTTHSCRKPAPERKQRDACRSRSARRRGGGQRCHAAISRRLYFRISARLPPMPPPRWRMRDRRPVSRAVLRRVFARARGDFLFAHLLVRRVRPDQGVLRSQLLRSEEHTSELQSLMRNSYAVFCLKKKKK